MDIVSKFALGFGKRIGKTSFIKMKVRTLIKLLSQVFMMCIQTTLKPITFYITNRKMDLTRAKEYITQRLVNDLSENMYYHGAHHTFAVVKATAMLAAAEGVSKYEYNLLLTAAYFHDSGFLFQYNSNEPFAVELATEMLPKFDYSDKDIQEINKIILATQSHITPSTLLEKIMCDADHDYIGTNDYHVIAKTLRKELDTQGRKYANLEWIKLQHTYLTTQHTYYTETAKKNRLPKKEEIIKELHQLIIEANKN